jgi:hypothetical protein
VLVFGLFRLGLDFFWVWFKVKLGFRQGLLAGWFRVYSVFLGLMYGWFRVSLGLV